MKTRVTPAAGQPSVSVYLFYGDEFLVKEQVQTLLNTILEPDLRDTNLIVLDGASLDISYLSAQLFTPSLFGGARVLLVENAIQFSGRTDHQKVLAKVMDSWTSDDRKGVFKALGQLFGMVGIDLDSIEHGTDWIDEILGESGTSGDRETLSQAAREFLAERGNVGSKADDDVIEEMILASFPEQTFLIFAAASADKRKKIFKAVQKRGRVVECSVRHERRGSALEKSFFEGRVRQALSNVGKTITPSAMQKMYTRSGSDLRQLHSEIDKLIAYLGERREINVEDVDALFNDVHEAEFFDFTNALRSADIAKCLPALHENLKIVSHPLQTLATVANEVRRLMVARELLFTTFRRTWKPAMSYERFVPILAGIRQDTPGAKEKGKFNLLTINDYALYTLLRDSQKFTLEKLIGIMEAILDADVLIKSSRLGARDPEAILENVVYEICKPERKLVG